MYKLVLNDKATFLYFLYVISLSVHKNILEFVFHARQLNMRSFDS